MRAAALLACSVLAAGCVNPKVEKMRADKAEVQARLQRYAALVLATDTAGLARMFAPDGEMVNPTRPPVIGRDAVAKFLASYSDYTVLLNEDTSSSVLIDGDTAEQLGTYHQKVRAPNGALFETSGRLEVEWVRAASGEWLIFQWAMFPAK